MREALGLSREVSQCADGYVKLERSLMSGLPNEVDFAMNVFLLLSSEGRYTLKGVRGRCVVDCMLSCVGISRGQCPLFINVLYTVPAAGILNLSLLVLAVFNCKPKSKHAANPILSLTRIHTPYCSPDTSCS